jgi:Putative peptidoglycan binding domain
MNKNKKTITIGLIMLVLGAGFSSFAHAQYVGTTNTFAITPAILPGAAVNTPYSQTLTAVTTSGDSLSWGITGGSFPPGLTLNSQAVGTTTVLSGTPTAPGSYVFTIGLTDRTNGASQNQTYVLDVSNFSGSTIGDSMTTTNTTTTAPTTSLEAEISALAQELNALEAAVANSTGQVLGDSTTIPSTITAATFTRDLTLGDVGPDVLALQEFLNAQGGEAQVATTGPGSPGNETEYYGLYTETAVARWQTMENISPAQGYFGPITRAAVIAMLSQ